MNGAPLRIHRALVLGPPEGAGPAHEAARLLVERLVRRTGCTAELRTDAAAAMQLDSAGEFPPRPDAAGRYDAVFLVTGDAAAPTAPGMRREPPQVMRDVALALRRRFGGLLPPPGTLPPEGFALRTVRMVGRLPLVVVLGADGRGALYGVGRLLRETVPGDGWVEVPALYLEHAPAFPVRGTGLAATSGAVAAALDLPRWTPAQWEGHVADLALWGYNLLRCGGGAQQAETARRYGLRVGVSVVPNRIAEEAVTPEMRGTHFQRALVCPSNPAARARIRAEREALFQTSPHIDVLYLPSGDHAG